MGRKGYPEGLKGDEIPLFARITAVADAFDAMTSSRSYRKALPFEEAHKRILEGKGSQFDPKLVEIFETIYPRWIEISNRYRKGIDMSERELKSSKKMKNKNIFMDSIPS